MKCAKKVFPHVLWMHCTHFMVISTLSRELPPTHHKFVLLFVSLWWPASCPFTQSVRYFPWLDLSSSHSSHCAPIIARLFVYVVGKCSKSKPSFLACRWPLSCCHLSCSLLSWHTSTVAVTLLGEDQVSFTPSLPPFPHGWPDGGGIPSVQTPCNWCSRLSIIWSLIDFTVSCLSFWPLSPLWLSDSKWGRIFPWTFRISVVTMSMLTTAIVFMPYQWSNLADETSGPITASKITCDPVFCESSHDLRPEYEILFAFPFILLYFIMT